MCLNQNKCVINKITRNRCKACRFNKCSNQGMHIDNIRMGRIPKAEKFSQKTNEERMEHNDIDQNIESLNKEINALLLFSKHNHTNTTNLDPLLFYPKEFKFWINRQFEYRN